MQASNAEKAIKLVVFLRMLALLASGELDLSVFGFNQEEINAVNGAGVILLGSDSATKDVIVREFLSSDGHFDGVSCKEYVLLMYLRLLSCFRFAAFRNM